MSGTPCQLPCQLDYVVPTLRTVLERVPPGTRTASVTLSLNQIPRSSMVQLAELSESTSSLLSPISHQATRDTSFPTRKDEFSVSNLTIDDLRTMQDAGIARAQELDIPYSIAILASDGHLKSVERMAGGRMINPDYAIKKAWTALAFQRPTEYVREIMMPDSMAYGIQHADERVLMVGGGYPIFDGDVLLGAIGSSAGTIEQDCEVCLEALEAGGFQTDFEDPFA